MPNIHIENLIENFSIDNLIAFFRNKIPSFNTDIEDLTFFFQENKFERYSSIEKIGEATIDSDELIIICSKTTDPITERTGKKRQYDIAKKILKQEIKDAAFFVFYDEGGNFRFSFVRANYLGDKRDFTDFKRYTYFVSPALTNNTFKRQIESCNFTTLDEIIEAFSVEPLNKQFYQEIAKAFYTLIGGKVKIGSRNVEFDSVMELPSIPIDENRKVYQEFAVRLIGRTIFCWFLKNKKSENGIPLVPESWLSSKAVKKTINEQNSYYHSVLEKLFFHALNKKVSDRENYFLPDEHELIPFLNGGLFDPHSNDFFTANQPNYALNIPNNWFLELFQVLEQFNFTIDENSIFDAEVSIDPEMLGTIFENLLAEIDPDTEKSARKATGSFYTPREIVDYMVEQSLLQYLKTKANITDDDALAQLFKEGGENKFNSNDTETILQAISNVKILDPACGSGAFPMGAVSKIITALKKLDPGAKWWKEQQVKSVTNAIARKKLKEKLDAATSDYARKLGVIQNSIYGVDIQPIAAEISKLRSFLSLVIDENIDDDAENRGIEPLPNLEFKFVTANTLIDLASKRDSSGFGFLDFGETGDLQSRLQELRNDYLQAYGDEKKTLKTKFRDTQIAIYRQEIAGSGGARKNERALQLAAWDPFGNESSVWFNPEWMFGIENFDIVIGNPPYRQVLKGKYDKNLFPYSEGKDKGKQNLYKLFVEQSYNLLKENGVATMIVQSSLMCDLSSTHTRELLLSKTTIKEFIEFPKSASDSRNQVFSNVLQGTCIYMFVKVKPDTNHYFEISINNDKNTIFNLIKEPLEQSYIDKLYPETYYIPLIKKGEAEILYKIRSEACTFKKYIESLSQGDLNLTSNSQHYGADETDIKLYRGKNIHKYKLLTEVDEYVSIHFKADVVSENMNNEYIVLQEITGTTDKFRIHAALTIVDDKYLFGHTANKIKLQNPKYNKLILGILNSKLLDWFFRKTSTNNHVMGYEIEQFPIIIPKSKRFLETIDKIIYLKQKNSDADNLEQEVNNIVFKLYNLSYDEVKLVDPEFSLTQSEYENYTIE